MIDINYSLRIAYKDALDGIAGVPVHYQSLPNNLFLDTYIVFRSIRNTHAGTKSSSDTDTRITVEIHTGEFIINQGLNADMIAREVLRRITDNPQFNLTMDGAQIVTTIAESDETQDFTMRDGRQYISRFITFKHNIFQRSDIS